MAWSLRVSPAIAAGAGSSGRTQRTNHGASSRLRILPGCLPRSNGIVRVFASHDPSAGKILRGGESMWRKELEQLQGPHSAFPAGNPVREDAPRISGARSNPQGLPSSGGRRRNGAQPRPLGLVTSLVQILLIADFFFILFILAWFLAGLVEKAAFDTFSLIDVWFLLWPFVFQPALGVFMAAAAFVALSRALSSKDGRI